jgi:DNA-binding MarR family transcriptional regulator
MPDIPRTARAEGGPDTPHLAMLLCFSLQNASRAFGGVYRQVLRDVELTYPQYLVMIVLWEQGDLTVKRMGELLRLDSGTLSPLLKRLESKGLVARVRSASDERSVIIELTEAGQELRVAAQQVPREIEAAAGLGNDEVLALQDLLGRLTTSLDAAAGQADK